MKNADSKVKLRKDEAALRRLTPISIAKYVKLHAASNPGTDVAELSRQLRRLLEAKAAGEICQCGEPIWVIGSAQAGLGCFTCITGQAVPDNDYEVVAGNVKAPTCRSTRTRNKGRPLRGECCVPVSSNVNSRGMRRGRASMDIADLLYYA